MDQPRKFEYLKKKRLNQPGQTDAYIMLRLLDGESTLPGLIQLLVHLVDLLLCVGLVIALVHVEDDLVLGTPGLHLVIVACTHVIICFNSPNYIQSKMSAFQSRKRLIIQ